MKAAVFREHGGPDVLETATVDAPTASRGETVVRVRACGVEPGLDVRTRQDGAGRHIELPHVLGAALAGQVAEADPADDRFPEGQAVVVNPVLSCAVCEYCRRGLDGSCRRRELLGVNRWGGYAELAAVPTRNLVALAPGVDFADAAVVPVSYTTAWHMLVRRARVAATDHVLVLGAAGPVGVASAQIARMHGSRCVVATRSADKAAQVRELVDPDGVVDPQSPSFEDDVRGLTDGGVDVVIDTVGAAAWPSALALLRAEGRMVCCGSPSGRTVEVQLRDLYRNNIAVYGSTIGTVADTRDVTDLLGRGRLHAAVAQTFGIDDAAAAHKALELGDHVGKIVLAHG